MKWILLFAVSMSLSTALWAVPTDPLEQDLLLNQLPDHIISPVREGQLDTSFVPIYGRHNKFIAGISPINITYGIANRWQVWGWIDVYRYRDHESPGAGFRGGFGNIRLGAEYTIPASTNPNLVQMSFGYEMVFPTASINKGLTAGFIQYRPEFTLVKMLDRGANELYLEAELGLLTRVKRPPIGVPLVRSSTESELQLGYAHFTKSWIYKLAMEWNSNRWVASGNFTTSYISPSVFWQYKRLQMGGSAFFGMSRQSFNYKLLAVLLYHLKYGELPGVGAVQRTRRR